MTRTTRGAAALAFAVLLVASTAGAGVAAAPDRTAAPRQTSLDSTQTTAHADRAWRTDDGLVRFESRRAAVAYLQRGAALRTVRTGRRPTLAASDGPAVVRDTAVESERAAGGGAGTPRYSGTNVQVAGVDEPDVVKGDGERLFYAPETSRAVAPLPGPTPGRRVAPPRRAGRTHVLDTSAPAEPRAVANVSASGDLLLVGDRLVVLGDDRVVGYDVSDAATPEREWSRALNGSVVTARSHDERVYLVVRTGVTPADPCPGRVLAGAPRVDCTDVHHPADAAPVDAVTTVFALDPATGAADDAASVVATRGTTVFGSESALYLTHRRPADAAALRLDFLLEEWRDGAPASLAARLRTIRSYDLSSRATWAETEAAVERWLATLPADRRAEVRADLDAAWADHLEARQRAVSRTGVVRVETDGDRVRVGAAGEVPGRPLNGFALDEHNGGLRVTTTVPRVRDARSRTDLYTLDAAGLDRRGSVEGMAPGQEVFAVRYVEETAYVVTFRRVDPFHVVDLSDPDDPEELGQVRLPGFSSYLHPVSEDRVLGVGRANGSAKLTLFDVSTPSEPRVVDSLPVDEGWSAVSESHHAFLLDRRHGVAFVPGSEGGHVVDYTDDTLRVERTVETDERPTRARYVDDSLYVFAGQEVVVVDQETGERTARLRL